MNFLFFDIGLFPLFLITESQNLSNDSLFLFMYAFTVLDFPDFSCILLFRLSQKLKFSSETPMKFPLPALQNYWLSLCFLSFIHVVINSCLVLTNKHRLTCCAVPVLFCAALPHPSRCVAPQIKFLFSSFWSLPPFIFLFTFFLSALDSVSLLFKVCTTPMLTFYP